MQNEFNPPAFVYVYFNKDGKPVYVGKVNAGNSLDSRINDHRSDYWYDEHLEIYYTPVESSATADILETVMINDYLAKGYPLNNIAKTTWGECSLISKDQFGWIPYVKNNNKQLEINKNKLESLDAMISLREERINKLFEQEQFLLSKINEEISNIQYYLKDLETLQKNFLE